MKVCDVEPKHISGFSNVFLRKDFEENIETPCLAACLWFYDLNIGTATANCHREDPNVYLYFDADSLDETNKIIAEELVKDEILTYTENGNTKWYGICFPATLEDDVEEISNRLLNVAKKFQHQDVLSPKWCLTRLQYYKYIINFYDDDYVKLCDEFEIGYSLNMDDEGNIYFGNDDDYNALIENNHLDEFVEKISELLDSKFQNEIQNGMGDADREVVFVNSELAMKHQQYLDSMKGIGTK